jgi:hypothetical protein
MPDRPGVERTRSFIDISCRHRLPHAHLELK